MQQIKRYCVGLIVACALVLVAFPASAWQFDDPRCAPEATYETTAGDPPQAMMMLDRSGSMGGLSCYLYNTCFIDWTNGWTYYLNCPSCTDAATCRDAFASISWIGNGAYSEPVRQESANCPSNPKTLWQTAVDAIDVLTYDMTQPDPDDVRFGLGLFHGRSATIKLDAAEDNHRAIMSELNSESPNGGTPMAKAIRTMKDSATIQSAPNGAAGVLITDGVPSSSRNDTVKAACEHRSVAPMYAVGFGAGTDEQFNNVLAAAGGSGSCNGGDPCSAPNKHDASYWTDRCTGSFQADNATELQNALNSISDQISCTFDISALAGNPNAPEWDDPAQGCNSTYDCLKIQLNGAVGERVFHKDSSSGPNGWEWASSAHTHIRLLNSDEGADDDYCQRARNGDLQDPNDDDVGATRACMCTRNTGGTCGATDMVPAPFTCECPVGTWTCNQGTDVCEPRNNNCPRPKVGEGGSCSVGVGACARDGAEACFNGTPYCDIEPGDPEPEVCDGTDNNCDGIVDNLPWDGTAVCHVDYGRDQDAIDDETKRCNLGTAECAGGRESCKPLEPMPEVCNGIDDDCDNMIDDLRGSWNDVKKDDGQPYSLPQKYRGATCNGREVCSCPDGPDDIEGEDFTSYIEGWANDPNDPSPDCLCGDSLTY